MRLHFSYTPLLFLAALFFHGISDVHAARTIVTTSQEYQRCTNLSKEHADQALEQAEQWLRISRNPSAMHCKAISLFNMNKYEDAAETLDILHDMLSDKDATLKFNLQRQSAKAWLRAGNSANAINRLGNVIASLIMDERPNPLHQRLLVEILMERADIYASSGEPLLAVQDYDHAESIGLLTDRVMLERGRLYLRMGETELAMEDAEAVLRLHPNHHAARTLLADIVSQSP